MMKDLHLHLTYGNRTVDETGRVDWADDWNARAHLFTATDPIVGNRRAYIHEILDILLDEMENDCEPT